jgi:hypothetical protein
MSHINRRTIVAGIAGPVPIAAVGAVPALASPSGELSFPDLAARFDALYAHWRDWSNRDHAQSELFDARLTAVTGLSRDEQPKPGEPGWDDFQVVWDRVWKELPHAPVNEDGEDIELAEIHDELWPLIDDIMEQPAKTLADLVIQARGGDVCSILGGSGTLRATSCFLLSNHTVTSTAASFARDRFTMSESLPSGRSLNRHMPG